MNAEFIPANLNAVELYSDFRQQLETLKADSNALVFDYASPKGNKEARSHIAGLRKICGALERARKDAKHDAQEYARLVDSKAKEIESELRSLIDTHEAPLLEIEAREQARIDAIKARMQTLDVAPLITPALTSAQLADILAGVEAFAIDASLAEFMAAAAIAKDQAIGELKNKLAARQQYEAEQAELDRLRKQEAIRQQQEREARIAQEAAEKARRDAEAKAEQDRMAAQRKSDQERLDAERAAQQQQLAIERAQREKAEAETRAANAEKEAKAKAERDIAAKLAAEKAEAEKREANKKHCARINNTAVDALVAGRIDADVAKQVIILIASRKVPAVSIEY